MAYAILPELKDSVKIKSTDDTRDIVLTRLLAAAEMAINGLCNRPDGFLAIAAAQPRYFPAKGGRYVNIDECIAISEVAVKMTNTGSFTVWTAPSSPLAGDGDWMPFRGDPKRPNFSRLPYTGILIDPGGSYAAFPNSGGFPAVRATARWGYAAEVPAQVREATIVQASRWYKRGEGAWSDVLANAETGLLLYRQALDPDVKAMLIMARLVRPAVG